MNIYVGNISWGLTDQDLENVFAEYGTVDSAKTFSRSWSVNPQEIFPTYIFIYLS